VASIVLSFFAGVLSVLSPCALPVLPVIVASALHRHAHGPLALAAGLVLSSTALGLALASFGFVIGVERDSTRAVSGAVLGIVGVILLVPRFQELFAQVVAPVTRGATALSAGLGGTLFGQFSLGLLLGAIWTPCTGPTLAAAVTLAARGESVARAGAIMLVFGLGAVAPVLVLAYASRHAVAARTRGFDSIARIGKPVLGGVLLAIGALSLSGTDRLVETWLVDHMPEWLLALTTRL